MVFHLFLSNFFTSGGRGGRAGDKLAPIDTLLIYFDEKWMKMMLMGPVQYNDAMGHMQI